MYDAYGCHDIGETIKPFVGIDAIVRQIIPCPVWQ